MKTLIYATIVIAALGLQGCSTSKKESKEAAANAKNMTENKPEETAKTAKQAAKRNKVSQVLSGNEVKCTSGSDTRTIAVKSVDAGCEVVYTKLGETNSVASASKGSEHCVNVLTKIKDNLGNAGFKCE